MQLSTEEDITDLQDTEASRPEPAVVVGPDDAASNSTEDFDHASTTADTPLSPFDAVPQHQNPSTEQLPELGSSLSNDAVQPPHGQRQDLSELSHTSYSESQLPEQIMLLQQQLDESQQRCRYLEALVAAHDSEQTALKQQNIQQARLASQQQSQFEAEKHGAHKLQQQLQASKQAAQALQQQMALQQGKLDQAKSRVSSLEDQLHATQQQLSSTQQSLTSQHDKEIANLQQQLEAQQQLVGSTHQELRTAREELSSARSELAKSQQCLADAEQQLELG